MAAAPAFQLLVSALRDAGAVPGTPDVLVQPHDDPDHDAAAAAFGLARLLSRYGFRTRIQHRGRVRSHSLLSMVAELDVPLERVRDEYSPELGDAPCVIVDGSPSHSNAKPLSRKLVGVIDHHPNPGPLDCPFVDIRTSYGSCASIVADYWMEAGLEPEKNTATALLMGIQMDTDFLARRVSPADLDAHHRLFFQSDWEFGTRVVKASLSVEDLPAFKYAAANARIEGGLFFTIVPLDCSQELISILADFFLRLKEISMTVIVEAGAGGRHVSIRTKSPDLSAAFVIRLALSGIGHGGGHDHMAGGIIDSAYYPGEEGLFLRFRTAMDAAQENQ